MRDLVKKSSKNLKDSPFGISEQLPLEIQKRRKEKLPLLKELRSRDIKAYFVKDKLFVGERVCLEYKEKGSFLVCGDLNSRIGEIDDVLSNDNLDLYLESVDHVETPIVPKRHSVDKTVNAFGRKLLQLCYNTELTIANGRLGNRVGKFTFCTMNGRSVNDYLLVSPSDYKLIKNFDVLNFNEFSDHAPLLFELEFRNFRPELSFPKIRNYIKWDIKRSNEYIDIIQQEQNNLLSLVNNITNTNNLNHAVKEFTNILFDSAHKVFGAVCDLEDQKLYTDLKILPLLNFLHQRLLTIYLTKKS
ncbi:Hypothetical predicted protein [Mytilus galloprovincialis]|uniref:Endonuclease/exonuclease/phosphatase domain-containing protein n=1 Tax=Mytilus galloprovincialis TaxID=29158 RepID=A0A8B6DNL9_MYTGA|nr:Hypothetical predicted protein [Mytilus galloprovincialis]